MSGEENVIAEQATENISKFQEFLDLNGGKLIATAIILAIGIILIKIIMKLMAKLLQKSHIDVTVHKFLLSTIRIVLWILVALTVLQLFNVPMTSIVAALSVCGLAISLAVQDSLSNIASGLIILFSKPFEVNDYIQLGDVEGKVMHINIIHTKLNTFDNKAIYIPNGQVSSEKVINYTREENRRLDLVFSISYQDDFRVAKQLIAEIVEAHPKALKEPAPLIRVCEHAASSINIAAKVWVKSEDYWDLNFDLLEEVKLAFDEHGINIPFNQLDVYLKQMKQS